MKRFALLGFGLLASVLAGCPVFTDNGDQGGPECTTRDCSGPGVCTQPTDCPINTTCGSDGQCHSGDCTQSGCPSRFTCVVDPSSQTASCDPTTGAGGGSPTSSTGTTMSSTSSGMGGGSSSTGGSSPTSSSSTSSGMGGTGGAPPKPVYCGHPSDCANGTICGKDGTCQPGPCSSSNTCVYGYSCVMGACQSPTQGACNSDADCSNGSVCIAGPDGKGGVCTTPANQCFDGSQCKSGENCVNGKCTLGCKSNSDCRDGFTCNTSTGVCSGIAQTCNVTNDCGSSTEVCVGGACVPRSSNASCASPGDVWDENGCVPNQAPSFICQNDGVQDACATGSICLHHDCWISCDPPAQNACANQPTLSTCKPVTEGTKTYNVCGTATNLGNQCGTGANDMTCSSGFTCVDGFCK